MKDISAYFEAYAIRKLGEAYRFPFPCPICHVQSATTWVEKQARTLSFCGCGCSDERRVYKVVGEWICHVTTLLAH